MRILAVKLNGIFRKALLLFYFIHPVAAPCYYHKTNHIYHFQGIEWNKKKNQTEAHFVSIC
jgi:hypothetical protein